MPILTRHYNPTFPTTIQQCPPLPPRACPDPCTPQAWDYGFKRVVPLLQSPPVGAGILSLTFFFFIVFFSNVIFTQISLATIGITVTLATLGLLALIILILFLIC